jgi:uncharacterized alkaline shock family protein YloU
VNASAVGAVDDSPTAPRAHALTEPADRGTLTVSARVVERVAGYAVTLVPEVTAAPRRVLGVNIGDARPQDAAAVDARVEGATATVEATIAVRWPTSVRDAADQVRRQIRNEVTRITDVRIDHVDLDVASMKMPVEPRRRVQ